MKATTYFERLCNTGSSLYAYELIRRAGEDKEVTFDQSVGLDGACDALFGGHKVRDDDPIFKVEE